MLVFIIVLQFVSTEKMVEFGDFIILKIIKTYNCPYPGNEFKYVSEICI